MLTENSSRMQHFMKERKRHKCHHISWIRVLMLNMALSSHKYTQFDKILKFIDKHPLYWRNILFLNDLCNLVQFKFVCFWNLLSYRVYNWILTVAFNISHQHIIGMVNKWVVLLFSTVCSEQMAYLLYII